AGGGGVPAEDAEFVADAVVPPARDPRLLLRGCLAGFRLALALELREPLLDLTEIRPPVAEAVAQEPGRCKRREVARQTGDPAEPLPVDRRRRAEREDAQRDSAADHR